MTITDNTASLRTLLTTVENLSFGSSVVVDSELSDTSTNPVQNKVITTALNDKAASEHTHTPDEVGITISTADPAFTGTPNTIYIQILE